MAMDFILVPLTVGLVAFFIYKFFELLICRKERMTIVDRIDANDMIEYLKQTRMGINLGNFARPESLRLSYPASWSLRIGCLILGMGLGLVLGIMLNQLVNCGDIFFMRDTLVSGSVLCLGGLGLIVAFIVEYGIYRKSNAGKK